MSKQYNDESSNPFILIDVRVWDALDIYETRVYGHIKRRAGENSHCWESLGNISAHVGFGQTKLKEVIRSLTEKRLLKKEKGEAGGTDRYFLTPPSHWVLAIPPSQGNYPPVAGRLPPQSRGDYKVDPFKVDPSKKNSLERTRKKESPDSESLISKTPESAHSDFEQTQNIPNCPLVVNPNPVDGEIGSATCSIVADKTKTIFGKTRSSVAQKQRAEGANWLSTGVANKRWKDRQDFDKFVAYAETYAENRRKDPKLNPDGTKYGKGYSATILSHTATSQDENDPMLACWKYWNQEAPPLPEIIKSNLPIVQTSSATLARIEAFRLQAAKDKEQRDAAASAKQIRLSDWGSECA